MAVPDTDSCRWLDPTCPVPLKGLRSRGEQGYHVQGLRRSQRYDCGEADHDSPTLTSSPSCGVYRGTISRRTEAARARASWGAQPAWMLRSLRLRLPPPSPVDASPSRPTTAQDRAGPPADESAPVPEVTTMAKQTTTHPPRPQPPAAVEVAQGHGQKDACAGTKLTRSFIARLIERHRDALERLAKR